MDSDLMSAMRTLKSSIRVVFSIFILCILFISCEQSNFCLEPQTLALKGGFYTKDTANKNVDTSVSNANLRFGSNSTFFTNYKNGSKFSFPLSQTQDTIPIIFESDSTSSSENLKDTFQLIYSRELHFISVACGYQTFYTLKNTITTNHVIDSVLIAVPSVTNETNKEHIKIVLKK